ncbi:MAG: hypothetical protein HKN05_01310 [Rhizobiales bacterium]|nr:hypothetical protein [Hyphomicrobiales bacterium]
MSAVAEDVAKIKSGQKTNAKEQLARLSKASGRSPLWMVLDHLRLRRGRGKLQLYEYFLYGLHDKDRWSEDERNRFLSAHIHWPIAKKCNDETWWAVTEDKGLSSIYLAHHGFPVPENVAAYDRGPRLYSGLPKLSSIADLKEFLSQFSRFPIFAKPTNGIWSAGAFRISGCSETHVNIDGRDPVSFEQLFDEVLGDTAYLMQICLEPHSFFDGITESIATVRSLNIITEDGLYVPNTILKLPRGENVADNFWRPGNLLCNLDSETGEICSIVDNVDGIRVELDKLPDSERALVGEYLPDWANLRKLNERVALAHGANRFGSTDIALTKRGPVVVEVNNGCAFELVQMATGQGFLTDPMLEFFREKGLFQ